MFTSIFLKTLRDQRWGIVCWGGGLALLIAMVIWMYPSFQADAAGLNQTYQSFGFLLGETVSIDTLGGFLTMEAMVWGTVLVGIWAAVMGVSIIRGEEEMGALDVLLSTPHNRMGAFAQKVAAIFTALFLAIVLMFIFMAVSPPLTNQTLPVESMAGTALNMLVLALFWGAAGLLAGQLISSRRTASLVTGTLIFATYLLNSTAETVPSIKWLTWILPFHYYNMSKPLVPGRNLDWWGIGVLVLAAIVLVGISAWLFARRDLGSAVRVLPARATARPASRGSTALLGSIFSKSLRDLLIPTLAWGVGLAIYCAVMVATTTEALEPIYKAMNAIPWFTKMFGELNTNEAYLSIGVFYYFPLLLACLALTIVWGWSSDEEEGRLEMLVSEPLPRWQVLAARYVAAVVSLVGVLALTAVGLLGTAAAVNLHLDAGKVIGALFACVPIALVVLAFGLALATWFGRPGVAVGIVGTVVALMFFLDVLAPLFDWPEAVRNLSVFHLYGRPLSEGVPWGNMWVLLIASVLVAAASFAGFARRDIAH